MMMHYSYFLYSIFFLVLLAIILSFRRDLIKDAIPAFVFGAVGGPLMEVLYTRDYWHPPSILRIGAVRIEDVLFGIAICGLTLVVYPFIFKKKLGPIHAGADRHIRSFGTLGLMTGLTLLLFFVYHLDSVFATAISTGIAWVLICASGRRDLFLPGLISGGIFALLATFVYGVFLNAFVSRSELNQIWLLHKSGLGITILGKVPLSELIWFFGVSSFLSTFELFVNKREYMPNVETSTVD
jgi:uncharacterized protein YjeT (DUF2065 family)